MTTTTTDFATVWFNAIRGTERASDERVEAVERLVGQAMRNADDGLVKFLCQACIGLTDLEFRGPLAVQLRGLAADCAAYCREIPAD